MNQLICNLEKKIKSPKQGLPEEVFLFISRITPLLNVDLFIKDKKKGILLTWRQKGEKYPEGWHFPGGILRYQEKIERRINKVAKLELKAKISFKKKPLAMNQIILSQKNRGHFISLLYECKLKSKISIDQYNFSNKKPKIGAYQWFRKCPSNLIKPHQVYRNLF